MQRWNTQALPPVDWPRHTTAPSRFRHLHTCVESVHEPQMLEVGYTAWQSFDEGPPIRLGWDWALIEGGVLVVADPLGIDTNLRLPPSEELPAPMAAAALHAMVRALPWQSAILIALQQSKAERDGAAHRRRRRDDPPLPG